MSLVPATGHSRSFQYPDDPGVAKAIEQNVVKQSPSLLALFPNTAFQMQVLAGTACEQQAQGKHFILIVPTWSDAWGDPKTKHLLTKSAVYFNMHAATGKQSYSAIRNLMSKTSGPIVHPRGDEIFIGSRKGSRSQLRFCGNPCQLCIPSREGWNPNVVDDL